MLFIAITTHSYNAVLCSVTVKDIKERQGNVRRMTLQFNELAIRDSLGNRKKNVKEHRAELKCQSQRIPTSEEPGVPLPEPKSW